MDKGDKNKDKKDKKQKIVYIDDGRSIADMSRIGMFGHVYSDAQLAARERKKQARKKDDLKLTKEERKAAFYGGLRAALPAFLMLLALCGALFLIIFLWFKP